MAEKVKNIDDILAQIKMDLKGGLTTLGRQESLQYLLLFMEDMVVWGKFEEDGGLLFGSDLQSLCSARLQQAHCFNQNMEIRIWKGAQDLVLCKLQEQQSKMCFTQEYLLWGSSSGKEDGVFATYQEGRRGFKQRIPLPLERGERAALRVKHSLKQDEDGQCYVHGSRLMDLIRWEVRS